MLRQSLSIARNNPAFYVMFVLCSVGASIFDEYSGKSASAGMTFFLSSMLAMNVQSSVLKDLNFTAAAKVRKLPIGGYMLRSFALTLLTCVLTALILLLALRSGGIGKAYLGLWAILVFLVVFTAIFSLFGTWLPAKLHGANAGIGDALRRGLVRFPSTASLIFLGLAVPLVVAFITLVLATEVGSADMIVNGRVNMTAVAISLGLNTLGAIGWTYVSVILVRRYMAAEHIEPPSGAELLTAFTS